MRRSCLCGGDPTRGVRLPCASDPRGVTLLLAGLLAACSSGTSAPTDTSGASAPGDQPTATASTEQPTASSARAFRSRRSAHRGPRLPTRLTPSLHWDPPEVAPATTTETVGGKQATVATLGVLCERRSCLVAAGCGYSTGGGDLRGPPLTDHFPCSRKPAGQSSGLHFVREVGGDDRIRTGE